MLTIDAISRFWGRRALLLLLLTVSLAFPLCALSQEQPQEPPVTSVRVEFFEDPGCKICERIQAHVLPELDLRFADLWELARIDTGVVSNYLRLARYQEAFSISPKETAVMIVQRRRAFCGWGPISKEMPGYIEECILTGLEPLPPPELEPDTSPAADDELLQRRVRRFTFWEVSAAGLIDGINPCAVSTIVFFLSLLTVFKASRGQRVAVGVAFCLASFVTYTAIGLGLLNALYLLDSFRGVRLGIEYAMFVALLLLAWLSFRDAVRFARSHRAEAVTLKLPDSVKRLIHGILRRRLGGAHLVAGGVLAGAVVTALESVCTGQVYLPTLVFVAGERGGVAGRAITMLLVYNTLFILPLVGAFILTMQGLRQEKLLSWSRRNVSLSKALLGLLFVAMAALIGYGLWGAGRFAEM